MPAFGTRLSIQRLFFRQREDIEMSSMKDKVAGVANQVAGKVKEETGKLTDNERLEAEGAAQNLKGKVQKTAGDAKDAVKSGIDKL
ncbi:CsbD family protein [Acetobacter cerevisiae]|nr:CsbD family protein [Acetobacter cerevisiae]